MPNDRNIKQIDICLDELAKLEADADELDR